MNIKNDRLSTKAHSVLVSGVSEQEIFSTESTATIFFLSISCALSYQSSKACYATRYNTIGTHCSLHRSACGAAARGLFNTARLVCQMHCQCKVRWLLATPVPFLLCSVVAVAFVQGDSRASEDPVREITEQLSKKKPSYPQL